MGVAAWHFWQFAASAVETAHGRTSAGAAGGGALGAPPVVCTTTGAVAPPVAVAAGATGAVAMPLPALGAPTFGVLVPDTGSFLVGAVAADDPQAAPIERTTAASERRVRLFR
jgi:hypothetical protein